jgi:hypothetical protein
MYTGKGRFFRKSEDETISLDPSSFSYGFIDRLCFQPESNGRQRIAHPFG